MESNHTGVKSFAIKNTPFGTWSALKLEFMRSPHTEVKAFLEDKGLPADSATYSATRGWRKDKQRFHEKSLAQAEKVALKESTESLAQKIKRRSAWWKTIQQAIAMKFVEKNKETGELKAREDMDSEEIFFLTKSYDIATKGERLEDGQPTVVEKIDQTNLHSFKFEELTDDDYERMRVEMTQALPKLHDATPTDDAPRADSIPRDEVRGESGEAVPTEVLPQP